MRLNTLATLFLDTASPFYAFRGRLRARLGMEPQPEGLQWTRKVMYDTLTHQLKSFEPEKMSVLEISPGDFWQRQGFGSYKATGFPEFDICSQALDEKFDLIIADQVFEHILWPYRAARNILSMLKEGGRFVVTTPFLIRMHDSPVDCTRWTELGMKHLLVEAGFEIDRVSTGSWGNKSCVLANLKRNGWAVFRRSSSLKNDPAFPCVVWAIAQK